VLYEPTSTFVSALRLAVDARDLATDTRGIGRYARAILRRLITRSDVELTLLLLGPFPQLRRTSLARALGSNRFRVSSRVRGCDVVWHPANGTFFESAVPAVVTLHDAVPFRFPHPDPVRRDNQQQPFLRSVATAARFIAVSEFGRREIVEVFGASADRIDVVYHGVESVFAPAPAGAAAEDALLFVGDPYAEERKNFPLLYDAYCAAFEGAEGPQLLVVGPSDPRQPRAQYAGIADGDARGGGDERLRDRYRSSLALCVPSFYETFGMPMIEAMACGTPVLASDASCLPEIAGGAALLVAANDRQAWTQALRRVAADADLRDQMRAAGIARARAFDWDRSASLHLQIFRSLQ